MGITLKSIMANPVRLISIRARFNRGPNLESRDLSTKSAPSVYDRQRSQCSFLRTDKRGNNLHMTDREIS